MSNRKNIQVFLAIFKAYLYTKSENLETADQNLIYDLYYASHSFLSVYPILENWIDGADICSSVERFQKEFLRIYQKEKI